MKRLIPIMLLFVFASCQKQTNLTVEKLQSEQEVLNRYKLSSLKNHAPIRYVSAQNLQSFTSESLEISLEEEDFHNTNIKYLIENGDTSTIFITKIFRDGGFVAAVIGFLLDDSRILNVVNVYHGQSDELHNIGVYYIDGTPIGHYSVDSDEIIVGEVIGEHDGEETASSQARSWWACTRECISDAHAACYQDYHCMTMLFITNTAGSGTTFGGQGSMSIGAACGISCIRNRNLDLLPGI